MAPARAQPGDDRQPGVEVENEGPVAAGPELGEIHVGREYAAVEPAIKP